MLYVPRMPGVTVLMACTHLGEGACGIKRISCEPKGIAQPRRHRRAAVSLRETPMGAGDFWHIPPCPMHHFGGVHTDPFTDWVLLPLPALQLEGYHKHRYCCVCSP